MLTVGVLLVAKHQVARHDLHTVRLEAVRDHMVPNGALVGMNVHHPHVFRETFHGLPRAVPTQPQVKQPSTP